MAYSAWPLCVREDFSFRLSDSISGRVHHMYLGTEKLKAENILSY